jgi:hypothetical protein
MFAMTLSSMGNCDEAMSEFKAFKESYTASDARTLEIIFKSHLERCKKVPVIPMKENATHNMANGLSYKIQFIAMRQAGAKFPRLANINEVKTEFVTSSKVYRYNLETYYELKQAVADMQQVRSLGFPDAFIAVYQDNTRVNTLYHAR